jgi:hypothetical protein
LNRHREGGRRNRAAQVTEIDGARSAQLAPPGAYEFGIDRRLEAENAPILTAVGKAGDAIGQSCAKRGAGIMSI